MKTLTLPLLAAALLATSPAQAAEKWKSIFDGTTLRGWIPKIRYEALGQDRSRTFRAQNRAIRVSYDGYDRFGGRFGHLMYHKPVEAPFRVRFQYRFYGDYLPDVQGWQHSNSGLMFLGQAPATVKVDQEFPVSMELQLLGADGPEPRPTGNLCTPGTHVVMAGKLVTEHCINSSSPTIRNGRWVQVEVDVREDGAITHFIDGKPVFRYSDPQLDPSDPDAKPLIAAAGGRLAITGGYLSLQSEGHPVEFRKIQLMELSRKHAGR